MIDLITKGRFEEVGPTGKQHEEKAKMIADHVTSAVMYTSSWS